MSTGRYETTNLINLRSAQRMDCGHPYGLTYQKCRFCGASWPDVEELWKYSVRHYICSSCRDRKLLDAAENTLLSDGSVERGEFDY